MNWMLSNTSLRVGSIGVSFSKGGINFSGTGNVSYDTASPVSTIVYY